ncbi:hypothetical protein C2S51_018329 [Perilla frutescens var. frutescens]|nr:hypothetical protein C2S51_018329 [Perilla frutescens var. frutescens]
MAFVAVISLKNTIHRLKSLINFPRITNAACDKELDSLISVLKRLDDERSRMIDRSVINELDAKIKDAVWRVEDVLDKSYYSLISPSQGGLDEKGMEEEINSLLKTVKILREEYDRALLQNKLPAEEGEDEALSLSAAVPPVNTVGLSDLSQSIINQLLQSPHSLLNFEFQRFVVSVVGMAGIVADILCGLDKTEEYWIKVAENKTTTFTDAYENIYEVLLSSYEYLPQQLKPCFLYMGVFPQSCQIRISKLSNLWAVEDFLEPPLNHPRTKSRRFVKTESEEQKLEEFAIECVEVLVSKSLAIVCEQRFCGFISTDRKIKSSKLHSAYWYVCVKEAGKSKFLHVLNKFTDVISIERPRRLSVQNNILLGLKEVYDTMAAATSTTRSLLCTGEDHQYPVPICFNMMLLMRVLDALAIRFYEFPNEVLKLIQLRYLSLTHNGELPSSINKLQQLRCLILCRHHNIKFLTAPTYFPDEIWDMEELRHLRIMGSNLPDPSEGKELSKLLTLYVNAHSCSKAVFRGIPNLKSLGITIELEPDAAAETVRCLEHIKLLDRLKSVKCVVVNPRLKSSQLAVAPPDHLSNLPESLKKLSLSGLGYSWKDMTAIASLPYLKVLKLRCSAFQGPHWETEVGQFKCLEFLLLEDIDLVHWTAHTSEFCNCFLRLRHLSVRHCYKLKKIPSKIGDISFLEMMEVDDCSPSVVASAHQIKEKKSRNYADLQVVINSSWNL